MSYQHFTPFFLAKIRVSAYIRCHIKAYCFLPRGFAGQPFQARRRPVFGCYDSKRFSHIYNLRRLACMLQFKSVRCVSVSISTRVRLLLAAIAFFVCVGAAMLMTAKPFAFIDSARALFGRQSNNVVFVETRTPAACINGPCAATSHAVMGLRPGEAPRVAAAAFTPAKMVSGGREVTGFSAKLPVQAKSEEPAAPAGLKPEETQAWLAMAKRQGPADKQALESFYPASYGVAFIVEGNGIRVGLRPIGGAASAAAVQEGNIIYRGAYPESDSKHVVTDGRSEEVLDL